MIRTQEEHLAHYGIKRRSGRYPWGSGDPETTRNRDFLDSVAILKKQGMSEKQIVEGLGLESISQLRAQKSIARAQVRQAKILTAQRHKEDGWSNVEIGRRMGLPESSVRALLAPGELDKADAIQTTANMLKDQVTKKQMIDVGIGVERHLGITRTRLDNGISVLKEQGYNLYTIHIQQVNAPDQFTKMKVLAAPGLSKSHVQQNRKDIQQISDYSVDNGRSFLTAQTPISISSRRVGVVYAEDGGAKADGMIYIRPGVKDLNLGQSRYSQVRIAVDGTHFLKGMAVYKDDLPAGVDIQVHTKKPNTGNKKDVMKPLKDDPELPFGAIVHQIHGPDGKVSSALNAVGSKEGAGEEGSWDTWSRNLSSQVLSKQEPSLATQQLNLTYQRRLKEYDEINSLTNPTVRKELLMQFADQTDAAAVHMKAASLPRQATKILLPLSTIKRDEIYAPGMRDGETVAVIRFPHGGRFEIPQLKVNNRNREGRKLFGRDARDAAGVHHSVAERLSGADFDGDTVLLIPNSRKQIRSQAALEGLRGFDPMTYQIPKDSPLPRVTDSKKQTEMGRISNLITDMTIKGANTEELSRAIRHSMVVIDSEKHQLDIVQSEKDHGIHALKEEYQGGKRRGATTLISRAGAETRIPERIPRPARRGGPIDPMTGKKVFEPTGRMVPVVRTRTDPATGRKIKVETGEFEPRRKVHERLAVTEDAFTLSSGTQMEAIYAEHSNTLKALANKARKEALPIKSAKASPSAKKVYAPEVESINAKLDNALRNAPRERQAQLLANVAVSQKKQANPNIEKDEEKKIRQQALQTYRVRTGAHKDKIVLTQKEWDAIQANAISADKLGKILKNSDPESIKRLAMPKHTPKLTSTMLRRAAGMKANGYTQQEIADALGIGLTTLKIGLNG